MFDDAYDILEATLTLGKAHEAKRDTEAACAAYRSVVDHLGEAKPKSVSAEHARARRAALGCK